VIAIGFDETDEPATAPAGTADHTLTTTQKWVLALTGLAFGLMIFLVIPWSSILGLEAGPARATTPTSPKSRTSGSSSAGGSRSCRCCPVRGAASGVALAATLE
jgi:hypothetical protein